MAFCLCFSSSLPKAYLSLLPTLSLLWTDITTLILLGGLYCPHSQCLLSGQGWGGELVSLERERCVRGHGISGVRTEQASNMQGLQEPQPRAPCFLWRWEVSLEMGLVPLLTARREESLLEKKGNARRNRTKK